MFVTQVVPSDATFEDYLQLSTAEDRSVSIPIGKWSRAQNSPDIALVALGRVAE
jgi:hypothetical protein